MPRPNSLYKYLTIDDMRIASIEMQTIWFSRPEKFNDPFDCQLKFTNYTHYFTNLILYKSLFSFQTKTGIQFANLIEDEKSKGKADEEIIDVIESELVKQGHQTAKSKLNNDLKNIQKDTSELGVLSLTEKNNNLLMWAHYANSHKGMCLEFSTNEAHPTANECMLNNNNYTRKVKYGIHYPSLIDLKPNNTSSIDLVNNLVYYKSIDWEYEQEWRCVIDKGNKVLPFPGKLTGIIFGAKTPDPDQIRLLSKLNNYSKKPDIYYSIIREDKFEVEIVKI